MTRYGARPKLRGSALGRLALAAVFARPRLFVVPGRTNALLAGIDLNDGKLEIAATPRHAEVLLLIGELPESMLDAASVIFAQMPRPRAVLALGTPPIASFPDALHFPLSQDGFEDGLEALRNASVGRENDGEIAMPFSAPSLQSRVEYTCPMHPEIVSDQPGNCPKCGMTLVPRETEGEAPNGHGGHQSHGHGPKGSDAASEDEHADHAHGHDHAEHGAQAVDDTSPSGQKPLHGEDHQSGDGHQSHQHGKDDHAEIEHKSHDGGMQVQEGHDHGEHDHGGHDHGGHDHGGGESPEGVEEGFMSMVEMTEGKPASRDGLIMEWFPLPFGPFFPGFPGGIVPTLTMDGDGVAEADIKSLVGRANMLAHAGSMPAAQFAQRMRAISPFSAEAYSLLALAAFESAAGSAASPEQATALPRARLAAGLSWLTQFLRLVDMSALAHEFEVALLKWARHEGFDPKPNLKRLSALQSSRLLRLRLKGLGRVDNGEDAWERFAIRTAEIWEDMQANGASPAGDDNPDLSRFARTSGSGSARLEIFGGSARLDVRLLEGHVVASQLTTPSQRRLSEVHQALIGCEVGDALVVLGTFGLDPWEMHA